MYNTHWTGITIIIVRVCRSVGRVLVPSSSCCCCIVGRKALLAFAQYKCMRCNEVRKASESLAVSEVSQNRKTME